MRNEKVNPQVEKDGDFTKTHIKEKIKNSIESSKAKVITLSTRTKALFASVISLSSMNQIQLATAYTGSQVTSSLSALAIAGGIGIGVAAGSYAIYRTAKWLKARRSTSSTSTNTLLIDKLSQLFDLKRTELSKLLYGETKYFDKTLIKDLDTVDLGNRPQTAESINDILELMYKVNQLDDNYNIEIGGLSSKEIAMELCLSYLIEENFIHEKSRDLFNIYSKIALLVSEDQNQNRFLNFDDLNMIILGTIASQNNRIEWYLIDGKDLPRGQYLKLRDFVSIYEHNNPTLANQINDALDLYNLGHLPFIYKKIIFRSELGKIVSNVPGGFDHNQYPIYLPIGRHIIKADGTMEGFGISHIWERHDVDLKDLGIWLGEDLTSNDKIADFIEKRIKTQGAVSLGEGSVIYAFQNIYGEYRFLELIIDYNQGKFKDYVGRVHTAYSVTPSIIQKYQAKFDYYISIFQHPNYSPLVRKV